MTPQRIRHPNLLSADRTLLVVVDMQETFLKPVWERKRVCTNVVLLMRAVQILGVPVITTAQYTERMGGPIPEVTALLPEGIQPLDKLCFSCAGETEFISKVKNSGRNQLLLCGIETHICVCQTALDMLSAGFKVHAAADAVSSRTESAWKLGLKKMAQSGVVIGSTEGAVYELMNQAGTPEFREVLKLIKDS